VLFPGAYPLVHGYGSSASSLATLISPNGLGAGGIIGCLLPFCPERITAISGSQVCE
jgi:hypothetical protein